MLFNLEIYEILYTYRKSKWTNNLHNQIKADKAYYVEDTYVFHPLKYLYSLKDILKDKIKIYENTKVI